MRPRRLRLDRETIRVLALPDLSRVVAGRPNQPGYTEPCITPRCSGEYTADCPY